MTKTFIYFVLFISLLAGSVWPSPRDPAMPRFPEAPPVVSSWDDLTSGITTLKQWQAHREVLKQRFLELIRDDRKPPRPPLDLITSETANVDGIYTRRLVTYNVEAGERAYAYIGIPAKREGRLPAVVALHGTNDLGAGQTAGLAGADPAKAFLDHLCRRGYVVIAPDHFVAGHRQPPEGSYETARFYQKHPQWTAVGKFTFEHSIAIDVLQSMPEVDPERIGVMGHSLGGQGTYFLAAYDERIKAAACNCSAPMFRDNPAVGEWGRNYWYVYLKNIRPGLLEGKLPPIDMHEIIALIAPRAFLDLCALNDGNGATQRQRVLMMMKIMDVYALYKQPGNFAFYVHGRGHGVAGESRALIYAWLDAHLIQSQTPAQ